ncbi:hypothetical protein [uncultured Desulfobacter sp.]|uniref:hypothetical protein n=1 Tax=uncultured Desulfobacter sp. TaxID=240139 RepID=UPI0029F58DF1|nr:hypothetical protein [uncultured Desulfobacter sp.]
MNPGNLIPVPDTIPVHWAWFQVLLIVTFVLHLLFMNAMLGSAIMALLREFKIDKDADAMNFQTAEKLPYTIAFTVNMGVAPLLFIQVLYGHFIYTSSILMAVYWLSIILLLILAYYAAYIYDFKFNAMGRSRTIFICISVILLLWIGFVFTNNMVMMIQPDTWSAYFRNPFGTLLALKDPMLVPRYLHFVLASVAVAGLLQAIFWTVKKKESVSDKAVRSGLNWFAWGTCIQFAVGIWFLVALPEDKMMLFMGRAPLQTFLLALGVLLGGAAIFTAARNKVWTTAALALATVVDMVLVRDLLRSAYLKPYFSPKQLTVVPEYSSMILFLVSFSAGIVIIAYMIKLAVAAGKEA